MNNTFVWWIGQVVSEDRWVKNNPGYPSRSDNEHKGHSERFKVRIMGHHTPKKSELPDDDLPWAYVMYPVTTGSGAASAWSNASIRQGNFVIGFFLDGEKCSQPIIMGILGIDQFTDLYKTDNPENSFVPFSGYTSRDIIARYALDVNKK